MSKRSNEFKPKSKEVIKEAVDIILNTEDDEAAIAFLKDTLEDDYPDLDLGRMDLHEAIGVLGGNSIKKAKKSGSRKAIEDLNKSLGNFIDTQESNIKKSRKKKNKKNKRNK